MLKKTWIGVLILFMLMISIYCKKDVQIKGLELEVTFSDERISDNLITDIQLKWKADSDFVKLNQNFNIFVHFWHDGNLLFQEDFIPEVPTSDWEINQEYMQTKRIYIPAFIDEFDPDFKGQETLKLSVGFFSPYDRSGESKQIILERKLDVFPPPEDTPEILYESGWFDLEREPDAFLKQWRWIGQEAKCLIDNPGRDALMVIRGGVNKEAIEDQKIVFKINDLIIDEFIPEESYFEKTYNIKKEMLGEGSEFYLTIATDKVFVPAKILPNSTDERELGFQVSFIYFR
jgi:hypothetical protein